MQSLSPRLVNHNCEDTQQFGTLVARIRREGKHKNFKHRHMHESQRGFRHMSNTEYIRSANDSIHIPHAAVSAIFSCTSLQAKARTPGITLLACRIFEHARKPPFSLHVRPVSICPGHDKYTYHKETRPSV